MNGGIPWRQPEDRKIFKDLTRDGILIIGRKTLEEHTNLVHINHARHCIILSRSTEDLGLAGIPCKTELHHVRSFLEALDLARELDNQDDEQPDTSRGLKCWVAGGERVYTEALRHPSAKELHLSIVDLDIDLGDAKDRAVFPAKYRWDNVFQQVSQTRFPPGDGSPGFSYTVYHRFK